MKACPNVKAKSASAQALRVVAAVIQKRGKLLICQRRADDVFPLKWEFPGGKVKRGETNQAALVRELREELDVGATIGRLLHETRHHYAGPSRLVRVTFFAARIGRAKPKNLAFRRIAWVAPGRLSSIDFLEADRKFITQIVAGNF